MGQPAIVGIVPGNLLVKSFFLCAMGTIPFQLFFEHNI